MKNSIHHDPQGTEETVEINFHDESSEEEEPLDYAKVMKYLHRPPRQQPDEQNVVYPEQYFNQTATAGAADPSSVQQNNQGPADENDYPTAGTNNDNVEKPKRPQHVKCVSLTDQYSFGIQKVPG